MKELEQFCPSEKRDFELEKIWDEKLQIFSDEKKMNDDNENNKKELVYQ